MSVLVRHSAEERQAPRSARQAALAWLVAAIFYFYQYVLRSAPSVMMPHLSQAFSLSTLGLASLVGLFYYGYSLFSLAAGAAMDRIGPKRTIPIAAVIIALGAYLFSVGNQNLAGVGRLFARFDSRTQDSGNVSFGLEAGGRRWFVKTAGDPASPAFLNHAERVVLLGNAEQLARDFAHPALPALRAVAASAWGPMLVYDWADGELLHAPAERRGDPASAFQRFRRLPAGAALCRAANYQPILSTPFSGVGPARWSSRSPLRYPLGHRPSRKPPAGRAEYPPQP